MLSGEIKYYDPCLQKVNLLSRQDVWACVHKWQRTVLVAQCARRNVLCCAPDCLVIVTHRDQRSGGGGLSFAWGAEWDSYSYIGCEGMLGRGQWKYSKYLRRISSDLEGRSLALDCRANITSEESEFREFLIYRSRKDLGNRLGTKKKIIFLED